MSENRNHWLDEFNTAFGVPNSRRKTVARALVAWWQAEGGATQGLPAPGRETNWNPFNTTLAKPGSHDQPGNDVPVQVYATRFDGMEATIDTLKESRYAAVRAAMLTPGVHARTICKRIVDSPWGTPSQPMLAVLDDIQQRGLYWDYAGITVYPS